MTRWFRFYDEALNDPKVQRLPGEKFKTWVNLLCLASKHDGVLPPLADISFALRLNADRLSLLLDEFYKLELLDEIEVPDAVSYCPHNWNARQYKSDKADVTAAERMRNYRERKKMASVTVTPVTERNTVTVTVPRADTEQIQSRTEQNRALPSVALCAVDGRSLKSKKRAVPLPSDWKPSLRAFEIAEQFGQNVQIVEGIFRDYIASSGKLYADYDAAFHNFIRNQNSFNRGGSNNGVRQSETRGSIIGVADKAIANLEREIADDNEMRPGVVLSLQPKRL